MKNPFIAFCVASLNQGVRNPAGGVAE